MTSCGFSSPEVASSTCGRRKTALAVCAMLVLGVVLVFCQTGRHEFVNFDDDQYVYDNPTIKSGLTLNGFWYFIVHRHSYTYHPITSYSHMLDYQLFGPQAGGHHWTNVILHAATAAGLFLVLRLMTGRFWPSAMTAAVFAIHPLRVESVAWISERRDVLSGLLFVLTLWAYARYVRRPRDRWRYAAVCASFAVGLLAKPMLVTLPLLLLLLDYWPLRRMQQGAGSAEQGDCEAESAEHETSSQEHAEESELPLPGPYPALSAPCPPLLAHCSVLTAPCSALRAPRFRLSVLWPLLTEKVPLALLALADCAVTLYTQGDGGAIQPLEIVSWTARLVNTPIAYANYIGCFFWPNRLAILYPHPCKDVDRHDAVIKLSLLAAASLAVWLLRRRMPYLLVGWLWYLAALVPVIGLLQVGGQSMADRYTYLPQIGLAMAVVWAFTAAAERLDSHRRYRCRAWLAIASAGILAALAGAAWRQTAYWHTSESLWNRELSFPQYNNVIAHYNLGLVLAEKGRHREAVAQYTAALARDPSDQASRLNLGLSYEALGSADAALRQYRQLAEDHPESTSGQHNFARLSKAMEEAGSRSEAGNPQPDQDPARIDEADNE